jgi:hypothetical protein
LVMNPAPPRSNKPPSTEESRNSQAGSLKVASHKELTWDKDSPKPPAKSSWLTPLVYADVRRDIPFEGNPTNPVSLRRLHQ